MKKNRKKHDPLNYYANRAESDAVEADRLSKSLGEVSVALHINVPSFNFDGGHRRGTQAHRAGAAGSSIHGSGAGTGARMSIDEFSGIEQMIEPALEDAGFAAGVVRGVRSFNVDKLGRLRGISYDQVWKPGENAAECRARAMDLVNAAAQRLGYYYGDPLNPNAANSYVPGFVGARTWTVPGEYAPEPRGAHSMSGCKHGFYAYYDGSNDYRDTDRVSAVIEGYGETVIGSRGFRCMKARIVALQIPDTVKPHIARMVARNYPEVPILETFDQMVTEFPPDSAGNELTPETDPDFWTRRA